MLRGPLLHSSSPSCSQVDNDIRDDHGSDATEEWIASSVWRFGKRKQRHLKLWGEIKAALLNFLLENGRAERVETFCLEVYSVPESPLESARRRSRREGRGVLSSIVAAWDHVRGKSPCPGTVMRAWLSWVDFPHLFFFPQYLSPLLSQYLIVSSSPRNCTDMEGSLSGAPFSCCCDGHLFSFQGSRVGLFASLVCSKQGWQQQMKMKWLILQMSVREPGPPVFRVSHSDILPVVCFCGVLGSCWP